MNLRRNNLYSIIIGYKLFQVGENLVFTLGPMFVNLREKFSPGPGFEPGILKNQVS